MTVHRADWIVIGAGGAGCSTTSALAHRRFSVVCLERFGLNHDRGSSHGRTRILRTAYSEGLDYVPLVLRARHLWQQLERSTSTRLFEPTGALVLGPPDGRMVSGALASAQSARLPYRLLSSVEVSQRFPAFQPESGEVGLWDPRGGVLFPERALKAMVRSAEARGARFEWHTRATHWKARPGEVVVQAGTDEYRARGLVIAAGAWTRQLVFDLGLPLEVERQTVFWYRPPRAVRGRFRRMPAFVWQRRSHGYFYGTPDFGDGVKVASDVGRRVQNPDHRGRSVGKRERILVERFVHQRLPQVAGRLTDSANCLYTNTPDHDFLVDFHPRFSNVVVVSACSGHGFKFVPAVGEAIARMAESGLRQPGWERFRFRRLRARAGPGNL